MEQHESQLAPLKIFTKYNNPDYPYMISRVSNSDYYLEVENEAPYGMGIFIDVYPWDGVGLTEKEMTKRKNKASKYSSLCYLSTRKKCIKYQNEKEINNKTTCISCFTYSWKRLFF